MRTQFPSYIFLLSLILLGTARAQQAHEAPNLSQAQAQPQTAHRWANTDLDERIRDLGIEPEDLIHVHPRYGKATLERRFARADVIERIVRAAQWLQSKDITLQRTDLSKHRGGSLKPHHGSHRFGLDADFCLIGKDGLGMSYRTIHDPEYSRENTEWMIRALIEQGGVQMIFFEDKVVNKRINQYYRRNIMHSITKPAHDNHIHVRWWADEEERVGSSGRGFYRVAAQ